jgi:hypothetical protein
VKPVATDTITLSNSDDDVVRGRCMFFFRINPSKAIDSKNVETEILCGELQGSPLDWLLYQLEHVYTPMIQTLDNWGRSKKEAFAVALESLIGPGLTRS